MARPATEVRRRRPGPEGREATMRAGIDAFRQRGYHGTSVRDLARLQDITVAALYHYFPSKYELLVAIMVRAMEDLIADLEEATREAGPDPRERLEAAVRAQVLFHTRRQSEAFVGNSELRSLEVAELRRVLHLRDHVERIFGDIIDEGIAEGEFPIDEAEDARRAILATTIAIYTWYRPRGKLDLEQVVERYVVLALRLVGIQQT